MVCGSPSKRAADAHGTAPCSLQGPLRAPGAQPGTSTGRSRGRRPRGSTPGITDRTDCSTPGITVACGCPGWGNTVKPHLGPRGRCARATVSPTLGAPPGCNNFGHEPDLFEPDSRNSLHAKLEFPPFPSLAFDRACKSTILRSPGGWGAHPPAPPPPPGGGTPQGVGIHQPAQCPGWGRRGAAPGEPRPPPPRGFRFPLT